MIQLFEYQKEKLIAQKEEADLNGNFAAVEKLEPEIAKLDKRIEDLKLKDQHPGIAPMIRGMKLNYEKMRKTFTSWYKLYYFQFPKRKLYGNYN